MAKHLKVSPELKLKNPWILAVIALVIVITFVSLYLNKAPSAGQAVSVGNAPWTGDTINLEEEGSIIFTALPAQSITVPLSIANDVYGEVAEYQFMLARLDEHTYQYTLAFPNNPPFAIDIVYTGGTLDSSPIYLDTFDGTPEMEVLYQNGQIIVQNLHFVSPQNAAITVVNPTTNLEYPLIIPVDLEEEFTAQIRAASVVVPEMNAVIIGSGTADFGVPIPNMDENSTSMDLSYTATALGSGPALLQINATVQGQVSTAYYTFAVGNRAYQLEEDNFPEIQLRISEDSSQPAELSILLRPTTELQALALPCSVTAPFTTLFAGKPVQRVYTYSNGAARVWTNQSPANDFTSFEPFQGYFVQLSEAVPMVITAQCPAQSIEPISVVFSNPGPQLSRQLSSGWNLFALGGITPRSLTEFISDSSLSLFECSQGYSCVEIDPSTALNPGKPYWIQTDTPLNFQYRIR